MRSRRFCGSNDKLADSHFNTCSHRERKPSAQKLYAQLPAHYVDHRWVKIESALLAQCTHLQGTLDMPKERLLSTLALVRAGVEYRSKVWALDIDQEASIDRKSVV